MISWDLLCYSGLSTQRNEKLQLLKCWEMTQTVPSPRPLPWTISPFPALWSNYRVPDIAGPNTESWGAGLRVSQGGFLRLSRESTHRVVYYDKVLVHPLMWNRLKGLHFPDTWIVIFIIQTVPNSQLQRPILGNDYWQFPFTMRTKTGHHNAVSSGVCLVDTDNTLSLNQHIFLLGHFYIRIICNLKRQRYSFLSFSYPEGF